jgi:hypothetical protein
MESTFDTPGGVDLYVQIGAGNIKLETSDRDTTEVHLVGLNRAGEDAIAEMSVRSDERGGRHEIFVEEPKKSGFGFVASLFNNAEIGVHVRCPRRTSLDAKTGSADVDVKGELESARVKTGSGDIDFRDVVDDIDVNSASGDVFVGDVNGHCSVKTASGDVRISVVGGELDANLVSGDLKVDEVRGSVTVQTVSGDQHIGAVSAGEIKLNAVSGDVLVGVRPGLRLWIDATSVSGDMTSELDSADGPPAGEGPLVQLRARTVSGDVSIVRAA